MDYQEKAAALNALADIAIKIRAPNDWYVSQSVEIKDGGVLVGKYGNGSTPKEAVENHWLELVDKLPPDKYLVIHANGDNRRAVRWNGYMWADVIEKKQ